MYSKKLAALKKVKQPDTTKSLLDELRIYEQLIESLPDGQEGIAMGLPKILIGVVDVFLRIGNTFKTNVTKFYKKLKRSEIRYFTESNRLKVAKVEDTPYARFIKAKSYAPTGMTSTYIAAVDNISKTYVQLALNDTIVPLIEKLVNVQNQLSNNDKSVAISLSDLARTATTRSKLIATTISENQRIFSTKRTPDVVEFIKLYKTMEEFRIVRSKLIELEPELNTTAGMVDTLSGTDERLVNLIEYMNVNYNELKLTKRFVDDLIVVVRYIGEGFDTQGRTSMQQMAMEHNHILNINNLYKAL